MNKKWFYLALLSVVFLLFSGLAFADDDDDDTEQGRLVQNLNVDALESDDENLSVIINAYKDLADLRLWSLLKHVSRNVTWSIEGVSSVVPFANTYEQRIGVLLYVTDVLRSVRLNEWYVRYYVKQGGMVNVHLYQEGMVLKTGKVFSMEIVHTWELDLDGKIILMHEYNDTYAMAKAFDPNADPQLSLVQNPADYDIPPSSFTESFDAAILLYSALGRGDIPYIIESLKNDIVWYLAGPEHITPMAGTFYGKSGVFDFFYRLGTTQAFIQFYLTRFVVEGSRIDVEFYEEIEVFATGKVYAITGLHTINFDNAGKVVSFRSYNDTYSVAAGHTLE